MSFKIAFKASFFIQNNWIKCVSVVSYKCLTISKTGVKRYPHIQNCECFIIYTSKLNISVLFIDSTLIFNKHWSKHKAKGVTMSHIFSNLLVKFKNEHYSFGKHKKQTKK